MSSERILMVALYYVQPGVSPAIPLFYATRSHVSNSTWAWTSDPFFVQGRLIQPGLIERTMYGPGKLRGASSVAAGAIVLSNADGALDSILPESFDGQQFLLYDIDPATLTVRTLLRRGYIEQPTWDDKSITFQVRDTLHALDVNLLTTKYAGTNALPAGIEGTADDIGGTPKPMLLGTCKNATPKQVNTSKKIYQIDGVRGLKAGYTLAVYDKRAVVTQDGAGDYTSQADMENNANIPAVGQYRVWPAGGCFRINFTPAGALTCDVTNPADKRTGGVAALKDVLYTLNGDILGSRSPDQSLGFLPAGQLYANNPDVGIYVDDSRTALSAVQELMTSAGAFVVSDFPLDYTYAGNVLNASQLYEPTSTPHYLAPLELNESRIVPDSLRLVPPSESDRGLPVWRVNVQYAKNWTPMTENDLAGVAAADVAYFTQEYRTAKAEDASVKTDWPAALELTVTTLIVDEADAVAEANRLLDLFGVPRQRFAVRVPLLVILTQAKTSGGTLYPDAFGIGAPITLKLPRFGLDAGKRFVVTEMRQDYEGEVVDLILWG